MSSQGTVSSDQDLPKSYEDRLLECWGEWARGGLGTGFTKSSVWAQERDGLLFSEKDILMADRAVGGMPPKFKRVVKMVYWFQTAGQAEHGIIAEALESFREHLYRNDEER